MTDSKLAIGLLRQETRHLAPACEISRLDGFKFVSVLMERCGTPSRITKAVYNVALMSYAKSVASSAATLTATMERMGENRRANATRTFLLPTKVERRRRYDSEDWDGEFEWGVGVDDLKLGRGTMEGASWTCGATVARHFATRHMIRMGHENPRAALAAGAACAPMALLYRDCQLTDGPGREPWDIIVPMAGGIACGGTEAVICKDLGSQIWVGTQCSETIEGTAGPGLHLAASLRTFITLSDIEGHRALAVAAITAWMDEHHGPLGESARDTHSRNPWQPSKARIALVESFMPIAHRVQKSFSAWRRGFEAAGRNGCSDPEPKPPGDELLHPWAAAIAATATRIGMQQQRRRG